MEPAVYLKLCLPHLKSASTTSTQQTASVLKTLTATVKGTSDERIKPHLEVKDFYSMIFDKKVGIKYYSEI